MRKGSRGQHPAGSFTAVFDRVVEKVGGRGPGKQTVHLKDVRDAEGTLVSRHQIFVLDEHFRALGDLTKGDKLAFDADMQELGSGGGQSAKYGTRQMTEYRLSHPRNVRKSD